MKTNQTPLAEYVSRQNSGTKYALAIQAEYAALVAVAEKANVLKWDDLPWKQRQELKQALSDLATIRSGKVAS